jgi:hypothetical protein
MSTPKTVENSIPLVLSLKLSVENFWKSLQPALLPLVSLVNSGFLFRPVVEVKSIKGLKHRIGLQPLNSV